MVSTGGFSPILGGRDGVFQGKRRTRRVNRRHDSDMKNIWPYLILVRGQGGSGKTTLSTSLAKVLRWPVLNRDDVKPVLRDVLQGESTIIGTSYAIMNTLARVQLKHDVSVILDACARFQAMEEQYVRMCAEHHATLVVMTCVCSNHAIWEHRIAQRGDTHPISFEATRAMPFEAFTSGNQLHLDTTISTEEDTVSQCVEYLREIGISS
jgi:predicted kinase